MPSSLTVFADQFLPPTAVSLGRLICRVQCPWQSFFKNTVHPLTRDDIVVSEFTNVRKLLEQSKGSVFALNLTKLVSVSYAAQTDGPNHHITTPRTMVYYLSNSDLLFGKMRRDEQVQRWLEVALQAYGQIFMCVGL